MIRKMTLPIGVLVILAWCLAGLRARPSTASTLLSRGYAVIPQPQMVQLKGKDFALSPGWRLELARGGSQDDIAVEGLKEGLASRFHLFLGSGAGRGHQGGVIRIETSPGSVKIGDATDRNKASLGGQAYRLDLGPEAINRFLKSAREAAARHDSARAVAALDAALDVVEELRAERNASLRDATDTW